MSTLPVTDPTVAAGEAGEGGGVSVRHCPSDYASLEFRLQAAPEQAVVLVLSGPSNVLCI